MHRYVRTRASRLASITHYEWRNTGIVLVFEQVASVVDEGNAVAPATAMQEAVRWKLLFGDVFRPPARFPELFAVVVGSGTQVFGTALIVLVAAACGFLSPANRGALLTGSYLLFCLSGFVGGYTTARTHKVLYEGLRREITSPRVPRLCLLPV